MEQTYQSSSRKGSYALWFMSFLWNAFILVVLFALYTDKKLHGVALVFYLVFQLIGLGLLIGAIYKTLQNRKYAKSVLFFKTGPVLVGSRVQARIVAPLNIYPEDQHFSFVVSNIHRYVSGSGDSRTTREKVLWQDKQRCPVELAEQEGDHQVIPFDFIVPFDCKETREEPEYFWQISISAETPGVDWMESFVFPVLRTEESSEELTESLAFLEKKEMSLAEITESFSQSKAPLLERPDGSFLVIKERCRNWLGSFVATVAMLGFWTGLGIVLGIGGFLESNAFMLLWRAIVGLVLSVFTLLTTLMFVVTVVMERKVLVHSQGLKIVENFIFFSRREEIPVSEITDFEIKSNMRKGETVYWSLLAKTEAGKDKAIVEHIIDKDALGQLEIYCHKLWT